MPVLKISYKIPFVVLFFSITSLTNICQNANAIVGRDDVTPVAGSYINPADPYNSFALNFPFVGQIDGTVATSFTRSSAVLIAPQYILTAAHTVTNFGYNDGNTTVYTPPTVRFPGSTPDTFTSYTIDTVTPANIHPSWVFYTDGNVADWRGADLAILHLTNPVVGITPVGLYTGNNEIGQSAAIAGFGNWGNGIAGGNNPSLSPDGFPYFIAKAGTNVIDGVAGQLGGIGNNYPGGYPFSNDYLITDFDSPTASNNTLSALGSSSTPLPTEAMLSANDSGAGLFIQNGLGVYELAGIGAETARPAGDNNPNFDYGEVSGFMRVSTQTAWINSVIGPSAVIPEPGTLALLLLGGISLRFAKRR
jgi:hypothetical protein